MSKLNFKQQILPHLIAIVVFLILTIIFFQPVLLENKEISQHDITQWRGSAQELIEYKDKTGEEGLWTNSMFGGMPAYLIQLSWSGDILAYVYDITSFWLPVPAKYVFISLISFYILLLAFKVRPYLAIIGAIAFAFNSFNIISIEAGHNLKVGAIAYMPLVIAGIHIAYNRNLWWGFIISTLGTALHIRMNHLQITYYLLFILIIYGILQLYFAYQDKRLPYFLKATLILLVAAILSVGANFGKLWSVYEYGQYSTRGASGLNGGDGASQASESSGLERDYVFNWSSGKLESMTLLIPDFYGGATQMALGMDSNLADALKRQGMGTMQIKETIEKAPTYWGSQPITAGAMYVGAIICFLFILGAFFAESKYKYWLIATTILSLLLSWGKNFEAFNYFLFDYLPAYSKFRSVSMAISIAFVCMPLLGFLGLENLLQKGISTKTTKSLLYAVGISGGLSLLVFLFAGTASFVGSVDAQLASYPEWFLNAIRADRESMMRSDALRSLFFIVASAAIIWFLIKQKLSAAIALPLLGLLVTIDLWMVDKRYLNENDFKRSASNQTFSKSEADEFILQDTAKNYRVFNLQGTWNEAVTSYYHNSIGGYHGAKVGRYNDLIEHCLTPTTNKLITNLQQGNMDMTQYPILNMLNTKYILAGNTRNAVINNEAAAGNAWFASDIVKVTSGREEMEQLCNSNTHKTAVVDVSEFEIPDVNPVTDGKITLVEYQPNYLKYTSESNTQGLALFSEIYYPAGWEAKIDGKNSPYIRANYVLRAMIIPPGSHTIEFEFVPDAYFTGNKIMLVSSILIILLFVGSLVLYIKKRYT